MKLRRAPILLTATWLACAGPLLNGAHAQTASSKAAISKPNKASRTATPTAPAPLPVASNEQISAAAMTHLGAYGCEFSQTVEVTADAKNQGYVAVQFGKQNWVMKPVLSSTGALRLEDVRGQMLMLQIANKSMLMDVKLGRRVVDECVHEKQRESNLSAQSGASGATPSILAVPK